jgi:hypothetical protein
MPVQDQVWCCGLITLVACAGPASRTPPVGRASAPLTSDAGTTAAASPDAAIVSIERVDAPLATVDANGVTLRRGDHVRVRSWAGTAKPAETGHGEVAVDAGRTGVFLGGRPRDPAPDLAPADLAVIRWDAQTWHAYTPPDTTVELGSFVTVIHPTYLELVP